MGRCGQKYDAEDKRKVCLLCTTMIRNKVSAVNTEMFEDGYSSEARVREISKLAKQFFKVAVFDTRCHSHADACPDEALIFRCTRSCAILHSWTIPRIYNCTLFGKRSVKKVTVASR